MTVLEGGQECPSSLSWIGSGDGFQGQTPFGEVWRLAEREHEPGDPRLVKNDRLPERFESCVAVRVGERPLELSPRLGESCPRRSVECSLEVGHLESRAV
jgi:hypothetical protein